MRENWPALTIKEAILSIGVLKRVFRIFVTLLIALAKAWYFHFKRKWDGSKRTRNIDYKKFKP